MGTNYIAPIWRMPRNANKDKLSNYSINLGGTNEYIDCGNSSNLDITGALTISFWIYGKSNASLTGIISKAPNTTSIVTNAQYHIEVNGSSNGLRFVVTGVDLRAGTETTGTVPTLTVDQWQHFVMTWNGTNEMIVYKNGVEVATKNQAKTIASNTNSVFLGRRNGYGYLEGQLSQACIFNYALDSTQVTYLYNLNNPMAISGGEPVAYWPLGDNSNPNAPGSFPNVSVGADSVFDFTSGEYVQLDDNDLLSFGDGTTDDPMSISVWCKTTDGTGNAILSKWGSGGPGVGYEYIFWIVGPNKIRLSLYGQNTTVNNVYRQTTTDVNTGEWTHVLATYDGRGGNNAQQGIKIYLNGVEESSYTESSVGSYQAMSNTGRSPQIGIYNTTAATTWEGPMSNLQVWRAELTAAQALELYNNGQPLMTGTQPQEANLQAWWKLNQSANWEADTTGNWQIPDAVSSYPQSFNFDGGNDYINIGSTIDFSGKNFTISGWYKITKSSGSSSMFSMGASKNIGIWHDGTNVNFYNQTSTSSWNGITAAMSKNVWHHVACVYDGTNRYIYIDGTLANSGAKSGSQNDDDTDQWIGYLAGVSSFAYEGQMSNVAIWDTNLNATQIETLYNNGVPLTTAIASDNLKAWYKLDNTETFTQNASGNEGWAVFNNTASPAITGTAISELNGSVNPGPYGGFNYFGWRAANYSDPTNYHSLPTTHLGFSCWYKYQGPTIPAGNATRYIFAATSASYYMTFTLNDNGSFRIYGDASNRYVSSSSSELTNGEWHNICVYMPNSTTNNASDIKLWIDGVEKNLSPSSGFTTYPQKTLWLGAYNYSGGGTAPRSDSFYDYVIYDTDISNDVSTIYNNGVPTDVSILNPYAYYKFDSTNITFVSNRFELTDLSGNNRNAFGPYRSSNDRPRLKSNSIRGGSSRSSGMTEQNLVNNNVSVVNGESVGMNTTNLVQSNLTRTQPFSNYSINFDANSLDYIQVANPGNIIGYGESAYTFSGWVNFDAIGNQDGIFGRYQDSSNRVTIKTGITSPYNGIVLQIQNGASNGYSEWTNIITTGQWYHICAVYDGSQGTQSNRLQLYLNGVTAGNRNNGSGTIPTTTTNMTASTPLDIGNDRRISGRVLDGKVSNYCVFDRVLTDAEILKIYNNGITQDLKATSSFSNNILGWWPMDANNSYYDGTNWTVRDLQGGKDGDGVNTGNVVGDMVGTAPGSEASGLGVNLAIEDLKGNMYNSDKNAYSINMADYADGVTNPANSGRSTDTP